MKSTSNSSPQAVMMAARNLLASAAVILSACTSTTSSDVVVSVKDQKMGLYSDGHLVKKYKISTSKFGLGDSPGSNRTPLGKHEIIAKIGHGLPTGAVLKSRSWNGEVLRPNAPGRDPIVSRILWLRGMESSNRNAMKRYIYIHGTPEESRLGKPASYGCIRMGMKDVVEVFNDVPIGAKVTVTRGGLPSGKKVEAKPTPEAETIIAQAPPVPPVSAKPISVAIPVPEAQADTAASAAKPKADSKVGPEAPTQKPDAKPVAKAKAKSTSSKPQKMTTSNRHHQILASRAHS
ncbi:MAG: L,D-transpeptidase [Verrucomicrobia bacterium]|nr:L,D-transpeptidase [Verrucomicrobiota bacterium]